MKRSRPKRPSYWDAIVFVAQEGATPIHYASPIVHLTATLFDMTPEQVVKDAEQYRVEGTTWLVRESRRASTK